METQPRGDSKIETNDVSETHETVDTAAAGSSQQAATLSPTLLSVDNLTSAII